MSLFQALVLLLFNDGDEFTLDDIQQATNIEVNKTTVQLNMFITYFVGGGFKIQTARKLHFKYRHFHTFLS